MNTKVNYDKPFTYFIYEAKKVTIYSTEDTYYDWYASLYFDGKKWQISESAFMSVDYDI